MFYTCYRPLNSLRRLSVHVDVYSIFTAELGELPTNFSLAYILVVVGGAILPAPAVPVRFRISARRNVSRDTTHPRIYLQALMHSL